MATKRRPLTDAEKEEKNRKQRERYAQQDPESKAKQAEENRARAQYVRDQKKRQLNQENANREEAERRKRQRQNQTEEDREARQVEDAERHRINRREEDEEETRIRQEEDRIRHQVQRDQETVEERMSRVLIDRQRHQLYRDNETEEEANERRKTHRELMANYRDTENEEETEERNEENRLRMERNREEREEEEEIIRATMAVDQSIIIPQETEEEQTFREQIMAARIRAGLPRTHRVACKPIFSEHLVPLHDCGPMNVICEECGARHFNGERPSDKKFTQCCRKGKVILPPPKECPAPLAQLLQNNHPKAKSFMRKIRTYNSAHAFASMRAEISSPPGRGPYCFRIHGQIYHNTTPMDKNTDKPQYADLYFMDSSQALEYRDHHEVNAGCCRHLMEEIDAMLRRLNPYAAVYKMMRQVLEEEYQRSQAENLPHRTVGMIISSDRKNLLNIAKIPLTFLTLTRLNLRPCTCVWWLFRPRFHRLT